jgi:hypothetical protein
VNLINSYRYTFTYFDLVLILFLIVRPFKAIEHYRMSRIPYEYKVEEQVILEIPGIPRKLSTPCTGPYPVRNVYKNGTIRIQKGKDELYQKERISVESLHSIRSPNKYNLGGK